MMALKAEFTFQAICGAMPQVLQSWIYPILSHHCVFHCYLECIKNDTSSVNYFFHQLNCCQAFQQTGTKQSLTGRNTTMSVVILNQDMVLKTRLSANKDIAVLVSSGPKVKLRNLRSIGTTSWASGSWRSRAGSRTRPPRRGPSHWRSWSFRWRSWSLHWRSWPRSGSWSRDWTSSWWSW